MSSVLGSSVSFVTSGSFSTTSDGIGGPSYEVPLRVVIALASFLGFGMTLNKDPDPKNPIDGKEERDVVTYPGFVDRLYLGAANELFLDNGLGNIISIKNTKKLFDHILMLSISIC
ncbi:hypothetical protein Tco_1290519 [Tanacetum coccineum]